MAEVSRGRRVLGRLLTALGLAWIFWGFLGPAFESGFGNSLVDVPIFPGIVMFFIGRVLSGGGRRRRTKPQEDTSTEARVPPRPEPRVRPAPIPERTIAKPVPATEPDAVSEVILEAFEAPEPDLAVPARKTSAEMVAEARERFGRRI